MMKTPKQTNLLSEKLLAPKIFLSPGVVLSTLFLVAITMSILSAGAIWSSWDAKNDLSLRKSALAEMQLQIDKVKPGLDKRSISIQQDLKEIDQKIAQSRDLLAAMGQSADAAAGHSAFSHSDVLAALAKIDASQIWLTRIEHDSVANTLVLHGKTLDADAVGPYVQSIAGQSALSGHGFGQLEVKAMEPIAGSMLWAFSIGAATKTGKP